MWNAHVPYDRLLNRMPAMREWSSISSCEYCVIGNDSRFVTDQDMRMSVGCGSEPKFRYSEEISDRSRNLAQQMPRTCRWITLPDLGTGKLQS